MIMVLHAVTQGLSLSPEQQAEGYFGGFERAQTTVTSYPLGADVDIVALDAAMTRAGATEVGSTLAVIDLGLPQGSAVDGIRYEELDLSADTPTGTVRLLDGTVPTAPGQVCLSPALAEKLGATTDVAFFDGALTLTPTCTAVDDHRRDSVAVYAAPGTWGAAGAGLAEDELRRWGVTASFNVYWSGGDADVVAAAMRSTVETSSPDAAEAGAPEAPESVTDFTDRPRTFNALSNAWGFLIPLLVVPALTSAIAGWGGARLMARSVDTLAALGLRRSRTRQLTLLPPLLLSALGALTGVALGALLGWAARSLLAALLPQPLGPWVGLPTVGATVLGMSLLGALIGSGLAMLRLSPRLREDLSWARRARVPWPSTLVLLGLMALCLLAAVFVASTGMQSTMRAAVVALVGMAAVLVVPLVLGLRARRGLAQRPAALLRSRLVTAAGGAWLVMVLFGFQAVLTTGTLTAVTSSVQTFNDSLVSAVPEDQARLALQSIGDTTIAQSIVEDTREVLGTDDDFTFTQLEAPTTMRDGPVVVVETARQAADVLGLPELDAATSDALQEGAAVRGGATPNGRLGVEDPEAAEPGVVVADLPVHVVDGVSGSLATGGAVILASTASGLPIAQSSPIAHVFPRLDPEQRAAAVRLPEELHFSPEWMDLPRAPDTVDVPEAIAWGAGLLSALGVVLALIYGLQAGAAGRRVLAGARAMGLRTSWVRTVLAGQIGWVVVAPTVVGVVGSSLGVAMLNAWQEVPVDLHVPWSLVGTMAVGTLVAFVGAVWLSLRGLTVRERIA
ncbi:hypothetical protein [Micrococcus sp.]|uniref:hypothetical protein n=1 Tax=Micrococcus sp. TaxID=1271 RepID=UPI0026DCFCEF|nr:hypothetical protein [Micrococcus sp.]MDO4239686.1 hypothetical protein [Micrococcus sp.]